MTSRKRIGTAQGTDDLGEAGPEGGFADVDVIRACGAVNRHHALGMAIWRWRYGGDERELPYIARGLMAQGHSLELVAKVLKYLSEETCQACEGRGYEVLPGTPILSEEMCGECQGAGKAPMAGEAERRLLNLIAQLEAATAAAIMEKLGREIDF